MRIPSFAIVLRLVVGGLLFLALIAAVMTTDRDMRARRLTCTGMVFVVLIICEHLARTNR